MAGLNCVIVTPEKTALDDKVDMVTVTMFDGEYGIAPNHSPLIGRLGYGELRLVTGNTTRRFYVDGGFVQVQDNVVSVLTNRVIESGELDRQAAQQALEESLAEVAHSPEAMDIRDRKQMQARGQLRVAERASS